MFSLYNINFVYFFRADHLVLEHQFKDPKDQGFAVRFCPLEMADTLYVVSPA